MKSLRELYRIGLGPSSSHTMGPQAAAIEYLEKHPEATAFDVTLYGSLAATGKGHMTDVAILRVLEPQGEVTIHWEPSVFLPFHPNGMKFAVRQPDGSLVDEWTVYSVGGGALSEGEEQDISQTDDAPLYPLTTMKAIMAWCQETGHAFWEYVEQCEGQEIWDYLREVWRVMQDAVERGIDHEGVLPGPLGLQRKAPIYYTKAKGYKANLQSSGLVYERILHALATAGLIGNLVKENASISGADVGCQGEVGVASAMASAAACQLFGGSVAQIEYAAEMGLEHHLGMTCDPVCGLVQIPCIERNAFAAARALDANFYASLSDGQHRVSFDRVVRVMKQTGKDLPSLYKETSEGGLAKLSEE